MNDKTEHPMDVWLFAGSSAIMALSVDRDGEGLPGEHGPWVRIRPVTLDHADEAEARALIRETWLLLLRRESQQGGGCYPMRS